MIYRVFAVQHGLDYQKLAAYQASDPDIQSYRTAVTNLRLEDVPFMDGSFTVLCDVSTGYPRPIVPKSLRRKVFDMVHALSHPGARTTKRLVASKFVWHGLNKEVTGWARTCMSCQRSKVRTHTKAPLQKFEPTSRRFDHVHIDLVGPLPESQGHKYLLTVIDRFTRWPEVVPLKNIETRTVAEAYVRVRNWIARFGVPSLRTSDRSPQFVSELWNAMSNLLGTSLNPTTAYHPQANGLVERLHRTLKASIKARLSGPNWMDELPWVLLGLRTTPIEDLSASPADLVYGAPLTVPGDFVPKASQEPVQEHLRRLREKVGGLKPIPTSAHGADQRQTNIPTSLATAKFVSMRREAKKPLETPYVGPYEVLECNDKYVKLQIGPREDKISIDHLKAALVDNESPIYPAQPPKRGRPSIQNRGKDDRNPSRIQGHVEAPQSVQIQPPQPQEPAMTKPTYAEVTTKSGRAVKKPNRYTN